MKGRQFGRYELVRKIASGGMAEVLLARQWGHGGFFRDLVIKRLFPHFASNAATLHMFQTEARLLAALSHPNVPQVFDLGFAEGTWFIAMEHIDGYNVADLWREGSRRGHFMPLPVALGVVIQICDALHHAHGAVDHVGRPLHIVHRDVSPQNIMLTREGVVKLLDFGVAQTAARPEPRSGTATGTYSYMAPEQVRGCHVDRRADVFAAAVILYELTTGTRLYHGTDTEVMIAVVEQEIPPPSSRVEGYPEELEHIVTNALQRDARYRTPSAADLALDLEEFGVRHGLRVGARTIAEYVDRAFPSDPGYAADAHYPHENTIPSSAHPSSAHPSSAVPSSDAAEHDRDISVSGPRRRFGVSDAGIRHSEFREPLVEHPAGSLDRGEPEGSELEPGDFGPGSMSEIWDRSPDELTPLDGFVDPPVASGPLVYSASAPLHSSLSPESGRYMLDLERRLEDEESG